jgi:hypothetical protein
MRKGGMIVFLIVLISFLGVSPAAADTQVDIGLNVPYFIGIETEDEDASAVMDYAFLLPDLKVNYFFNENGIRFGAGVRMFTLILETLAYPIVTVEAEFDKLVLSAHAGGGAFLFFGLLNDIAFESIYLPEVTVAYKLGERFSVGTGALLFMAPEVADFNNFAYVGTVFARFTF